MKKLLFVLLALTMCVSICSCTSNNVSKTEGIFDDASNSVSAGDENSVADTSPEKNDAEKANIPADSPIYDLYAIRDNCPIQVTEYNETSMVIKNSGNQEVTRVEVYVATVDATGEIIPVKSLLSTGQYSIYTANLSLAPDSSSTVKLANNLESDNKMAAYDAIVFSYTTSDGVKHINDAIDKWEPICLGMINDDEEPKEPTFDSECTLYKLRELNDTFGVKVADVDVLGDQFMVQIKNNSGLTINGVKVYLFAVDKDGKYVELISGGAYIEVSFFSSADSGSSMYGKFACSNMSEVAGYEAIIAQYSTNGQNIENPIATQWATLCVTEGTK